MKSTIKTLTLTVDELRQMIQSVKTADDAVMLTAAVDEAAQNPKKVDPEKFEHPAARLLAEKFRKKAERLEKQRLARKSRREQKAEVETIVSPPVPEVENDDESQRLVLELNDHLARSIAWIYINRVALSAAIKRINGAIAAQSPSCRFDPETIHLLIAFAEEVYDDVLLYQTQAACNRPSVLRVSRLFDRRRKNQKAASKFEF